MMEDAQFGPVLLFGQGGTAVEVVGDRALALPPLNLALAHVMMRETRVYKLLQGYRDRPPAALDAIALTLIKLSQLIADQPDIVELDINPLLADDKGVFALDARIKVRAARSRGTERFAIRPYPRQWESQELLRDGRSFAIRPIKPEDEPALMAFLERIDAEDLRLRFFSSLRHFSHHFVARLTQLDYGRTIAFLALDQASDEILGVVRLQQGKGGLGRRGRAGDGDQPVHEAAPVERLVGVFVVEFDDAAIERHGCLLSSGRPEG